MNATVKMFLPSAEDLRRVEAVLAFVYSEVERLQTALRFPEAAGVQAYNDACREGATPEEALSKAAGIEGEARHRLDDEAAGRLFMFLFDVIDDLERVEEMARDCLLQVKYARHDNSDGYDVDSRIRIQEAIAKMPMGGDDV